MYKTTKSNNSKFTTYIHIKTTILYQPTKEKKTKSIRITIINSDKTQNIIDII